MTKFLDGPATGQTLMLTRTPIFLRVTKHIDGRFDALNQLEDRARADETLHCYVMEKYNGGTFIDGAKIHGFFYMADYRLREPQPTDADMRSNEAWATWCESQPDKETLRNNLQQV